jgi:RND family efflux transporter MFP subunit
MIKNIILLAVSGMLVISACAPPSDPETRLARLEAERDALTARIEQLRAEVAGESVAPAQEPPVYVRAVEVLPSLFRHFIQVQGTLESDNNILVPAQANGMVEKIHVREGDLVRQGQLLAELDGSILESNIAELKNQLSLASTVYERQSRLWAKNIGSEIEYLQAKTNKESLEKRLETLQEQYELTKIRTPISGTVDDVQIKVGEMAAAGRGVIRIVQLSQLKVTAALSENYISRVKAGDTVTVSIPILGRTMELTIDAVSQVIDPNNRTFEIEVRIPNGTQGLKPNLLAVITINDYTKPEALVVPQNVVQETGAGHFLFVAENGNGGWIARRRDVIPGESYDDRVEILEGLRPGEKVITMGFQDLADGEPVSLQDTE